MRFSELPAVVLFLFGGAVALDAQETVDPRAGGIEVGLGEWAVSLEADDIRPGPVTFVIHNRGTLPHGLRVRSRSRKRRGRNRFEERSVLILPGERAELIVDLPPGTYRIDCYVEDADVGDHGDLGMETALTVREDAPLLPEGPVAEGDGSPAVLIERFVFSPGDLEVPVGATVVWTNRDATRHTVTAEEGAFDSSLLEQDGTFSRLFDEPGVFVYLCSLHPGMKGTVTVVR